MEIQIAKFGGSSLNESSCLIQVAGLIKHSPVGLVTVVSAMGGVTDLLLRKDNSVQAFQEFQARTQKALADLQISFHFDWQQAAQTTGVERVALGERMMVNILVALLKKEGVKAIEVDAAQLIRTRQGPTGLVHDPKACETLAQQCLMPLLEQGFYPVVPGFIGLNPRSELVTLGRGGTDYTATILGASLKAERVTLYKEVDGLLTADPKYVAKPQLIGTLNYQEAAELSYYGAKILHPRSIIPLIALKIPLFIKNTFHPERPGTKISVERDVEVQNPVRALTAITGQVLISLEGCGMMGVPGVAMRTFKAMSESMISVTLISQASSEASICFTISGQDEAQALEALRREFAFELENNLIERLQTYGPVSIVATVGKSMKGQRGLSAKVFGSFKHANVNVIAIAQGSSEYNISMVINEVETPLAIQTLHHAFFGVETLHEVQVALNGFGQIAQALTQQIVAQEEYLKSEMGISIQVKAVSDSKSQMIFDRPASSQELLELVECKRGTGLLSPRSTSRGPWIPGQAGNDKTCGVIHFEKIGSHRGICVDLSASDTHATLLSALRNRFDVVLANKKPIAGDFQRYQELFEVAKEYGVQLRYEATVGAGLPIIDTIDKLKQAGDKPLQIQGCFSGTLGYLMSALDAGETFSKAVQKAKALGLTEPDPLEDLRGTDVARKALILARELDERLELADIETESLANISDEEFEERVHRAKSSNKRLRYIAQLCPGAPIRVGLQEVGPDSPFYYLTGTTNQISLKTSRYFDSPLVVTGPGAGAGVTAAGVLNDLVALAVRAYEVG